MALDRLMAAISLLALLSACAQPPAANAPSANAPGTAAAPASAPGTASAPPPKSAVTVEQFDTTTPAERQAAAAAPAAPSEKMLGTTIASLGDPADPGFWAETGLVDAPTKGRLEYHPNGKSVQVELRPSGGAPGSGTRVSLPAMRVLDLPLAGLPELVVFAAP